MGLLAGSQTENRLDVDKLLSGEGGNRKEIKAIAMDSGARFPITPSYRQEEDVGKR
jgi:hypothetical protein